MTAQLSTAYHFPPGKPQRGPAGMRAFASLAKLRGLTPRVEQDGFREYEGVGLIASLREHGDEGFISLRLNGEEDSLGAFFNDLDKKLGAMGFQRFHEATDDSG